MGCVFFLFKNKNNNYGFGESVLQGSAGLLPSCAAQRHECVEGGGIESSVQGRGLRPVEQSLLGLLQVQDKLANAHADAVCSLLMEARQAPAPEERERMRENRMVSSSLISTHSHHWASRRHHMAGSPAESASRQNRQPSSPWPTTTAEQQQQQKRPALASKQAGEQKIFLFSSFEEASSTRKHRRGQHQPLHGISSYSLSEMAHSVVWGHAVNSQRELSDTLADPRTDMIEADVIVGSDGTLLMGHPPATHSDLSLADFLARVPKKRRKQHVNGECESLLYLRFGGNQWIFAPLPSPSNPLLFFCCCKCRIGQQT
jgi:hypothetical protein